MIHIDIENMQDEVAVDKRKVRSWANKALKHLDKTEAELSLVICDNNYIKQLNKHYLKKDKPTNVISFPQQEGDGITGNHLGDIVISAERAVDEALKAGIQSEERLKQLVIHGICHLCGFNHEDVSKEKVTEMEMKEKEILSLIA